MKAGTLSTKARSVRHRLPYVWDGLVVLGWLAVVELAVRLVSLRRLSALLGAPLATDEAPVLHDRHPHLRRREARRLRMLDVLGPRWPFCDGPCLRQALVAGRVLRRHGPMLRIGAALDGPQLVGHAWLEVGDMRFGQSDRFATLFSSES